MKTETDNSVQDQNATCDNNVLVAGFSEDDYIEGVFLIKAKSEQTFYNRKSRLQEITGFSDGGCGSYEQDEESGIWNLITTAHFDTVAELKTDIEKMKKYNWFFFQDFYLMLDGKYLFSDGKWLV
mgnify:CR=1 FL=1|jgi:hypothetical protein